MGILLKNNQSFDAKKYSPLVHDGEPDLKPGTVSYDDYWDEQDYRCIHGYKPTGMPAITGEHYFYLNMCKISLLPKGQKRKMPGNPFYRALDRRLCNETSDAKKNQYGLIVGKPRRVGLSWFGAMQIVYELLFYLRAEVGVCAGKQDKADDFYKKVLYLLKTINPAYKSGIITKNDEELKLGYAYTENKQQEEDGLLSQMFIKTMFADSSSFEGKSLALCIFEEAGLFENLIASYKATEPCFMEGSEQFGVPLIYGTGGEIEKGSKGYKEMYEKASVYNLKKIFIPAYEYYPGDGIPDKKTGKSITFFDFRTGETNQEAAKKYIMQKREIAKKSKEGYTKHVQSYPVKESEIFIKSKGGLLDRRILNTQLIRLNEGDIPMRIVKGRLEWVDTPECKKIVSRIVGEKKKQVVRMKYKSKVKFIEDEDGWLTKIADPINKKNAEYKPDIAGIDSYDDEVDQDDTHSLGAMIVYRCYAGPSTMSEMPIAYFKERGDSSSDDIFFEHSLMTAIYYDCETLIEYSKMAIITHWKDVGGQKYLKMRPQLEEVMGKSKAKNEYGQRMSKREKDLGTKLLKSEVKENVYKIMFRDIVIDLIDYGDVNTDLAMAYVMVLIFKLEMFPDIVDESNFEMEEAEDDLLSLSYYDVSNGELIIKQYGEQETENIETFDPMVHLNSGEKLEYKKQLQQQKTDFENHKKEIEEKYGNDLMAIIINDFNKDS